MLRLPPIYPITDKALAHRASHLSIIRELVRGGARLVQIRDKDSPARELIADIKRCVEFCRDRGVTLLVNDRCDLVLSADAHGVHLGQDDLPPAAARNILGMRRIIGLSAHTSWQIRKANRLPIDYCGFGPVFPTATKSDLAPCTGLRGLRSACSLSRQPVVAIGGIGVRQVGAVLEAGAASAAIISGLMTAPDLARRMEESLRAARGRE